MIVYKVFRTLYMSRNVISQNQWTIDHSILFTYLLLICLLKSNPGTRFQIRFLVTSLQLIGSSDAVTCLVPRTRMCLGDRAFGVAGPRTSVERFADQPPSASPLPWTVPTGAENAFIWLCLQGLVTFCFRRWL